MKKTVKVNGENAKVEYTVISSDLLEDNSKPSQKYKGIMAICKIFKITISIDGKEYSSMKMFTQNGGCYSEKWLGKGGVWVSSEKKLIESFLN